ncbi:hypothetical protein TRFO_12213 [Tritrichomonas foetus]|uniref:Uncharacterized protein n=1 Tax=Tritrichomonas foetus TaxID=1144522 RepID=A0A1J4J3W7_9EUKA|nr:hypothetical protein TRFO_12213 [Tritrichomonas foetus]|eukprot:OHS92855.1 hypothetical protein TRFO_12213 [Tritrichomonas foetus]
MYFEPRRAEQFQYQVQTKVNLANDEISRLMGDLAILKGQICEYQDKLNKANYKMAQSLCMFDGKDKLTQVSIKTQIAKLQKAHNIRLQEIQTRHNQEVRNLHADFEETMKLIQKKSADNLNQQNLEYDQMVKREKELLRNLQYEFNLSQNSYKSQKFDPEMAQNHDREMKRMKQLEKTIAKRTQERLDTMLEGKARLAECVDALDEMERNHENEMMGYKMKLEALENRYKEKINRETDRHKSMMSALTRKVANYENKINSMQKTLHKIEKHHKKQIDHAIKEGESFHYLAENAKSFANSVSYHDDQYSFSKDSGHFNNHSFYSRSTRNNSNVDELLNRLNQLRENLETKENELMTERTENESLKREIARLKHEEKMSSRRKAWISQSSP